MLRCTDFPRRESLCRGRSRELRRDERQTRWRAVALVRRLIRNYRHHDDSCVREHQGGPYRDDSKRRARPPDRRRHGLFGHAARHDHDDRDADDFRHRRRRHHPHEQPHQIRIRAHGQLQARATALLPRNRKDHGHDHLHPLRDVLRIHLQPHGRTPQRGPALHRGPRRRPHRRLLANHGACVPDKTVRERTVDQ